MAQLYSLGHYAHFMKTLTPKKRASLLRVTTFSALALALYVFSVGPVLIGAERFGVSHTRLAQPLHAFYFPVLATARSCSVGTHVYEGYVGIWCRVILGHDFPDDERYK